MLANTFFPCFKLRLNEKNRHTARLQESHQFRNNQTQRNKRNIDRKKCNRFCNSCFRQLANICLLQVNHPSILPQFLCQLIPSDINRIYFLSTILQHAVRKTACRSANIHTDCPLQRKGTQKRKRCFQFQSSPSYILQTSIGYRKLIGF